MNTTPSHPPTDIPSPTEPKPSWGMWCIVGAVFGVGLVVGGVLGTRPAPQASSTPFSGTTLSIANGNTTSKSDGPLETNADAQHIEELLGSWLRPDYFGKTVLTLQPNGQGTMHIEFSTMYSYLVDDELTVDIVWAVQDGRCVFESVSGRPQAAFDLVTKLKGKLRDQKIIEVTEQRAVFLDDKRDNEQKIWTRLADTK